MLVNGKKPAVYIAKSQIDEKVQILGKEITNFYKEFCTDDDVLVVIGVLKGAYIFLADLVRELSIPQQIEFVRISSYGDGTVSSGNIQAPDLNLPTSIMNRHILIVEDIVDTGQTANFLMKYIDEQFQPKTLKLASFLNKPSRREIDIEPDWTCFEIEDKFVIGYGLDFAEKYRDLPYLAYIDMNE